MLLLILFATGFLGRIEASSSSSPDTDVHLSDFEYTTSSSSGKNHGKLTARSLLGIRCSPKTETDVLELRREQGSWRTWTSFNLVSDKEKTRSEDESNSEGASSSNDTLHSSDFDSSVTPPTHGLSSLETEVDMWVSSNPVTIDGRRLDGSRRRQSIDEIMRRTLEAQNYLQRQSSISTSPTSFSGTGTGASDTGRRRPLVRTWRVHGRTNSRADGLFARIGRLPDEVGEVSEEEERIMKEEKTEDVLGNDWFNLEEPSPPAQRLPSSSPRTRPHNNALSLSGLTMTDRLRETDGKRRLSPGHCPLVSVSREPTPPVSDRTDNASSSSSSSE